MSRQALKGIGQVIKANTTEKSIEALQAEGKKRVRVVSSERVMAIIQAIVDDTINAEVGAITTRDRERIVSDTKERFSQVLRMQQDLEQVVDELRESLRGAELERDRLRGEKSLLEAQLEAQRRDEGDDDAMAKLARDVARLRDAVERSSQGAGTVDEAALARVVERLTARDAQVSRRLDTEFEDLRRRIESVGRDAAASRDAAMEKVLQRVDAQKSDADAQFAARMERELRAVSERLAEMGKTAGRAPAAEDAAAKLRSQFDAIEKRVHGAETSSGELAVRVTNAVLNGLDERDAAADKERAAASAAEAAQTAEQIRRLQRSSEDAREAVLSEVASLRAAFDESKKRGADVHAEHLHGLEQRLAAGATESAVVLARSVERLAERVAAVDGSIQSVRGDLADAVDRAVAGGASASHAETAARLDGALAQLVGEMTAMNARAAESAERQHEAVKALRDHVAQNAAVQSGSLESTFKGALEQALDKITKTMERATARPIETTGEATDVLLAKMFDMPDVEMTSNLDQLDVEQRTTKSKIADSVGRLKEMNGRDRPGGK